MKQFSILQTMVSLFLFLALSLIGTTPTFASQRVVPVGPKNINDLAKPLTDQKIISDLWSKIDSQQALANSSSIETQPTFGAGAIIITPGTQATFTSTPPQSFFVLGTPLKRGDTIMGRLITPLGDQLRLAPWVFGFDVEPGLIVNTQVPINTQSSFTQQGIYVFEIFIFTQSNNLALRAAALLPVGLQNITTPSLISYQKDEFGVVYKFDRVVSPVTQIYLGNTNVTRFMVLSGDKIFLNKGYEDFFAQGTNTTMPFTIVNGEFSQSIMVPVVTRNLPPPTGN